MDIHRSPEFDAFARETYQTARGTSRRLGYMFNLLMFHEDIVQNAYLTAFEQWDELCQHPNRLGWIKKTITMMYLNLNRNELTKRRKLPQFFYPEELIDPVAAIERLSEQGSFLGKFHRAILRLSSREKEVLSLDILDGMETAEIAALLNLSPSAVRSHRSAAINKLKIDEFFAEDKHGEDNDGAE